MSERLPREIDPLRLADEGVQLEGELPGEIFSRLREMSAPGSRQEPVRLNLQFERTGHGIRLLHGTIQTRFVATCQRCLGPVTLLLEAKPLMALQATGESPDTAPDNAEVLTVDGPVRLANLVEDELLLVMPMISMHDNTNCHAPDRRANETEEETDKPFAALRNLNLKMKEK